jgi:SAM-dependent methyltransferase
MLAYYAASYYGQKNVRFSVLIERMVSWLRRRRADKICGLIPNGRVLDIGCGRGHILHNLRQRGWTVQGVELNADAATHARDVLGLDVAVESFNPERFADGSFDVIIMWHVLEHLPDVGSVLAACRRMLRPGGLLVVSVPNLESWQARLTRHHWFHLDLPRHYSHFGESWLTGRLSDGGFRVHEVNHFAFEQNPFGWIQSLLNCCGLRKNLLYDMMKNRSARAIASPFWQFPIQSLASVVGFLLLVLPAWLMLIPEMVFRRGATIDVFATRVD